MNDGAGLEQDADRRKQHEARADCQLQPADLEEEARQRCPQQHEEASGNETTEEAHVLAGDQHIGRQATEYQRGHGERGTDNFSATLHAQVAVENRAEQEAHETGQGERRHQAPGRITKLVGQEEQTIEADQHHENVRVTDTHLLSDKRHHAAECEGESE
ncbi:hypothetical protein D3C85_1438490 [compost metagenome]